MQMWNLKLVNSSLFLCTLQHVSELEQKAHLSFKNNETCDADIEVHLKKCGHNLETIDLLECDMISDVAISKICSFPSVSSLSLRGCKKVSDAALFEISESQLCLHSLDIAGCFNVTEMGLTKLLTSPVGSGLISLNISGIRFDVAVLSLLPNHCRALQSLHMG